MKTIHKHVIPRKDQFTIELPIDAEVLHVGIQRNVPHMWVLLDDDEPTYPRVFSLHGTGHDCANCSAQAHLGTFLTTDDLVFHLFCETRNAKRQ